MTKTLSLKLKINDPVFYDKLKKRGCKYCGSMEDLTIDHKQPLVLKGTDDKKNLQCLCAKCNRLKSGLPHWHIVKIINEWETNWKFNKRFAKRFTK